MTTLETAFHCGLVSLLWGATNPLIKKSTKDITKIKGNNPVKRLFNDIRYLVVNWKYLLLFLVNQAGSVLYLILLNNAELSLIVPTVNALTFVFTGLVGSLLGEGTPNLRTFLGIVLILVGISCCVIDRVHVTNSTK